MRIVLQRVTKASVKVEDKIVGAIKKGLLIFVGVSNDDDCSDVDYLVKKIVNLRIFTDDEGKMNRSLFDNKYEILSISQFTLFANTNKGNRPSFTDAASPEYAKNMYEIFNQKITDLDIRLERGIFGASMKVELVNDGPVTIILDSKKR
ncbi:MAG: D-aminoacyl-tRNA deacylase [Bacilli bacterium]|nr:D-aminoacyl-tRNA deacylase [Bacilli bacterium]